MALEADGEKSRQLTGDDHGPFATQDIAGLVERLRNDIPLYEKAGATVVVKNFSKAASALENLAAENARLRRFAEDAKHFSTDPNTVADARAALGDTPAGK